MKVSTNIFKQAIDALAVVQELPFSSFSTLTVDRDVMSQGENKVAIQRRGLNQLNLRGWVDGEWKLSRSSFGLFFKADNEEMYLTYTKTSMYTIIVIEGVGELTIPQEGVPVWASKTHKIPDAATQLRIQTAAFGMAQRLINRFSRVDLL